MPAIPHSLRIPEPLDGELRRELEHRSASDWSSGVLSLLEEGVRMSRVPGIVFVDGRGGRRAAVAFSGLEVWEIVATWQESGARWEALVEAYPELSASQLQAAVAYYHAYPEEIDVRLAREAFWTAERVADELPFTRLGLAYRPGET